MSIKNDTGHSLVVGSHAFFFGSGDLYGVLQQIKLSPTIHSVLQLLEQKKLETVDAVKRRDLANMEDDFTKWAHIQTQQQPTQIFSAGELLTENQLSARIVLQKVLIVNSGAPRSWRKTERAATEYGVVAQLQALRRWEPGEVFLARGVRFYVARGGYVGAMVWCLPDGMFEGSDTCLSVHSLPPDWSPRA